MHNENDDTYYDDDDDDDDDDDEDVGDITHNDNVLGHDRHNRSLILLSIIENQTGLRDLLPKLATNVTHH